MIRGLILDWKHEGHLINLAEPMLSIRMVNPMPRISYDMPVSLIPEYLPEIASEYKLVFSPVDGGDVYLYAQGKSEDVFLRQNRDWVIKDKAVRSYPRRSITFEDNDPHVSNRYEVVKRYIETIKQNVVPRDGFDLEGHLFVLMNAVK